MKFLTQLGMILTGNLLAIFAIVSIMFVYPILCNVIKKCISTLAYLIPPLLFIICGEVLK